MVLVELQERGRVQELGILDMVLKVHGINSASKGEGIIRLIYKNVNDISNRLSNNKKVEKAKEIHSKLEVDITAYCEHWLNMQDRHNINGFDQMFKGGEVAVQSVVAHNTQ